MCDKVVGTCPFIFDSVLDWYIIQEICDKAVDSYLLALKLASDWFVMSKMIEKLDSLLMTLSLGI